MSQNFTDTLRAYDISPNLQFKLSDLISNSPLNFQVQSDCVMLNIRDGFIADVYFCDNDFTRIQYNLAIEGVTCLKDIKVKYNPSAQFKKMVNIVFRVKNKIFFYQGPPQLQQQSQIMNSGFNQSPYPQVQFSQSSQIIEISDFFISNHYGISCLITTITGKIYFLNYLSKVLTIKDTNPGNKITNFFKIIAKPLYKQQKLLKKCGSFLYSTDQAQSFYALLIQDNTLYMKFFNLTKSNFNIQSNNWQINLQQTLQQSNMNIINWKFIQKQINSQKHIISLILICQIEGMKLSLYDLSIDFNTKINHIQTVRDLFNNRRVDESAYAEDMVPENQHLFNRNTQYIQIQYYEQKLYLMYHKKVQQKYKEGIVSRKQHILQIIKKKKQDNKYKFLTPKIFTIIQQLRLIKIGQQKQKRQKLLLLGQSTCFYFGLPYENRSQRSQSIHSQNMQYQQSQQSERVNKIPPIPHYQDHQQHYKYPKPPPLMQAQQTYNDERQFQNPFSKFKLQKAITKHNLSFLFKYLYHQKLKFDELLNENLIITSQILIQIDKQFMINILLKTFTNMEQSNITENTKLINDIFVHFLQPRLVKIQGNKTIVDQNNKKTQKIFSNRYTQLLTGIFISHEYNEFILVIKALTELKKIRQLYKIFSEIIPNFLQALTTNLNEQMQSQQKSSFNIKQSIANIQNMVISRYLSSYEQFITGLTQEFPKQMRNENSEVAGFTQYQHKVLLDAYFSLFRLLSTQQSQKKISLFRQITQAYLPLSKNFRKFLSKMAIKYTNVTIFDCLARRRLVTKTDVTQFVSNNLSKQNQNQFLGILMNLIQTQIDRLKNDGMSNKIDNNGVYILYWIPTKYSQEIYLKLLYSHPLLAIIFGLTIKSRRQVAKDIDNILSKKQIDLFSPISNPQIVINLLYPLYNYLNSKSVKLNYDLAHIFNNNNLIFVCDKIFLRSANKYNVTQDQFTKFKEKIEKYTSGQEINKIIEKFSLI